MNKILLALMFITISSCSSVKNISKTNTHTDKIEKIEKAKVKTEADSPNQYHIVGTSQIKSPHSHDNKTYFLYGAEHLNLENYYFDIPVVYNASVKKWINYFLKRGRGFFSRYSARAGRYAPLMGQILEEHGLPRDLIFLAMAESGFHNKAKSWAKAVGPWQFMPYTGKAYGLKIDWYIDERRDPIKATMAASRYLTKLYNDFESWELAAAAYNAGEGKIGRAIRRYRTENFWRIKKGRYLKSETKNYVPKIMALAIIGKNLKTFGFHDIDFYAPLDFEEIDVKGMTDLYKVAEKLEVDFEDLQYLNPEILRWYTSPKIASYKLRVPVGVKAKWDECCAGQALVADNFMKYKIKGRSARLHDVARKFKIKKKYMGIMHSLNDTKLNKRFSRGELVYLPFKAGQNIKDNMYADLYEKPRKSVRRRRSYRRRIKMAMRRGRRISSPSGYYTVKRGDSLWTVARKNSISLDNLIASNIKIVKHRMIRAGDKLIVR